MPYRSLPPSSPHSGASSALERLMARALGWLMWGMLALMGLVFALSLLVWVAVMIGASLIASVFTGRPAAVTVLWRRYREMTRQRWPGRQPGRTTPDTGSASAQATGQVQDVNWREVPTATTARPPSTQHDEQS